ncbi:MAG: HutD family protein, partial [Rubrivivax sp.]|nr:HutD family protein [Rubrivivax sp.]
SRSGRTEHAMSTARTITVDRAPATPWRNGGGVTRELLAWPDPADWRLRVSVADIERSGPFSPFPGVERWFAVTSGGEVELALPGGNLCIGPDDAPLRFDGEAAPACRLLRGPSHDLNLMHRRGTGVATMSRARATSRLDGGWAWQALYAADEAMLDLDGHTEALPAGTLLWSDGGDAVSWHLRHAGHAWWLTLEV